MWDLSEFGVGGIVEKRRRKRVFGRIRLIWEDGVLSERGVTWDVSPDGVFIVSNKSPAAGSMLDLRFFYGEGLFLSCKGTVVWVNHGQVEFFPPGFGVEFTGVDSQDIEYILNYGMEEIYFH